MKIKDKVEGMLKTNSDLRNSDKKLLLAVWESQGLHLTLYQKEVFMNQCSAAESITRARRLLRDRYPESKKVYEQRHNLFIDYKYDHAISWREE